MLNPPLSLLSDDLFAYIVDHVAELPSPNKHLCNLSIADRAFTWLCQRHIFKVLHLGGNRSRHENSMSSRLDMMRKILVEKPSFANSVRVVDISSNENPLPLFNDLNFISIFQLVAESLMPPYKLDLSGHSLMRQFRFRDPILIVGRLMQTFFSQSLTVLHLTYCMDVPFTVFLICPRLREVVLNNVRASTDSYDGYPDEQCSGREFPTLDSLEYRSGSLVEQMITPPPRFHTAVPVLWSKLRVLTLSPYGDEGIPYLQPILDVTCNTLEELYFVKPSTMSSVAIGHVDLRNLSSLHVLAFYIKYHSYISGGFRDFNPKYSSDTSGVLRDFNVVLNTIPTSNRVTNLTLNLDVFELSVFHGCPDEDWVGLCDQVVRISGGKHFTLTFDVLLREFSGGEELYEIIKEKIVSLSEYPNICIVDPRSMG